jgi:hypothetical protein
MHLIDDGMRRLVSDKIVFATRELISGMLAHRGIRLRSSRLPELFDIEVCQIAHENRNLPHVKNALQPRHSRFSRNLADQLDQGLLGRRLPPPADPSGRGCEI